MRISRIALNIQIAMLIAKRGTCNRLQVGCVITRNNKIVATGYNGPPKDEEHCKETMCNTDEPCKRAIHAERNAIMQLPTFKVDDHDEVIYVTHQPCYFCANEILATTNAHTIYYLNEYRDKSGIDLLKKFRPEMKIYHINELGETQNEI